MTQNLDNPSDRPATEIAQALIDALALQDSVSVDDDRLDEGGRRIEGRVYLDGEFDMLAAVRKAISRERMLEFLRSTQA